MPRCKSTLNTSGFYILVLSIQLLILITSIAYCNVLMGGTIKQFIFSIFAAILPLKSTTVPPVTVAEEQQEELNTVAT
ncbi:unnamed protein product [Caenorhabditis angaria]|uniref:Uncharacterized protein n=1 Tax=Caenorhabditis angaria TaxID=860376 RepID=A0A9P1I726_9PELO|nr:unnamed protein product [Caenorhabditis angaria]